MSDFINNYWILLIPSIFLIISILLPSYLHEHGHKRAIIKSYKKYGIEKPDIKIKIFTLHHPFTFSSFYKILEKDRDSKTTQETIKYNAINGAKYQFIYFVLSDLFILIVYFANINSYILNNQNNLLIYRIMLLWYIITQIVLSIIFLALSTDFRYYRHPDNFEYHPEKH